MNRIQHAILHHLLEDEDYQESIKGKNREDLEDITRDYLMENHNGIHSEIALYVIQEQGYDEVLERLLTQNSKYS